MNQELQIFVLPHGAGLPLPAYATEGAAAFDFLAAVEQPQTLLPGARALIPTGLCMAVPAGHELQIRPRSGLALKFGITVLNSPGTIDSDYRGEIGVLLYNTGDQPFTINRGDRIAQGLLASVQQPHLVAVMSLADLGETARGAGGFGSTGRN